MLSYRSKFFGGGTSGGSGPITVTGPIQATTIRAVAPGTVTITNATNATPIVVTAVSHGLVTGDNISISGITGNTNANGYFKITRLTADTFSLQNYSTGADIAGTGAYGGAPVAVTGIVRANRVLVGNGTASQPALGIVGDDGTGIYGDGAGSIYISSQGSGFYKFGASFTLVGTSSTFGWADAQISRPAAATLQLGAAASGTPVAQTLQSQGATGTDVAGANLTIRPGAGTGAATGSSLIFQTPTATTTGTTAQTQSTRLTLDSGSNRSTNNFHPSATDSYELGFSNLQWQAIGVARAIRGSKTKTLTESSATGFVDIAVTAGQRISGEVIYEVYAADATDFQTITGRLRYAAVNKAGTTTVTVSEVGTQTTAVSTGTLTATNTAADTTNKITLSCNAVSSLTQTTLEIRYRLDSVSTNTITPL